MRILRSIASFTLAAAICIGSLPEAPHLTQVSAEGVTYTSGQWKYELRDDVEGSEGETCAVITKWTAEDEKTSVLSVPESIDGYTVAGIEGTPFDDSGSTSVAMWITIPGTVTYLADGFLGKSVFMFTMPNGVSYANMRYVNNATGETNIISDELWVSGYEGAETDLVIPESIADYPVIAIDSYCFYTENFTWSDPEDEEPVTTVAASNEVYIEDENRSGEAANDPTAELKSITLPESIVYIGSCAFQNSNIESINIPSGVMLIRSCAFSNCKSLKNIDFPDTPVFAEASAFYNVNVKLPDNVVYNQGSNQKYLRFGEWDVRPVFSMNEKPSHYLLEVWRYNGTDTDIYMPAELNGYGVSEVNLNFPDNCEDYYDGKRVSVYIPEGVRADIGTMEFIKSVTYMGESCNMPDLWLSDSHIEEVNLPPNVDMGREAFQGVTELKTVNFSGGGDISIGSNAFKGCTSLTKIDLPEDAKSITIGSGAFSGTGITEMTFPASVISIGSKPFEDCENVERLTFEGATELKYSTFNGMTSFKEITFADGMTIGCSCFRNCTSLENINIPDGAYVNGEAFSGCFALMKINGEEVLDENGDIKPDMLDTVKRCFGGADDVGFINAYVEHMVKQTVSEVVTDGMSDMEKLKALHDWVCLAASYDGGNESDPKNHADSSIFLNDSTVCDGYARALDLLLQEAGIESCYVKTSNHAWVIVMLGDHYFHVDPTWDRGGDGVEYYWFLQNDEKVGAEKSCHSDWRISQPSSLHSLQWAELPECSDLMGDVDFNGVLDGIDASAILTHYAMISSGKESGIDEIIADLDFNGIVDGRDASVALTRYAQASVEK